MKNLNISNHMPVRSQTLVGSLGDSLGCRLGGTGYFLLHFLPKIIVFETSTKPEGFVMILALAVSAG